jgi:hypothetical protein
LHFHNGVFPDGDAAIVDEPASFKGADYFPAKILHADLPVPAFHFWHVHTMNDHYAACLYYPEQFPDQELKMPVELFVISGIAHVPVRV